MAIEKEVDLSPYNSFAVSAVASHFSNVTNADGLLEALEYGEKMGLPIQILGAGSNVLFTGAYPGLVCRIANRGVEIDKESGRVQAAAGENWHALVQQCLSSGLYGLENLALIPGTCGAAPIQNIGAYGVEVADFFVELQALDRHNGAIVTLDKGACDFAYRDSIFKQQARGRYIILSICLKLSSQASVKTSYRALSEALAEVVDGPIDSVSPQQVFDTVCTIRQAKLPDPAVLGNAGSFFKNPIVSQDKYEKLLSEHGEVPAYESDEGFMKIPAAWMLERAGWKGKSRGKAAVHAHHALVLVNPGDASGEDILLLAQEMSSSVLSQFGVALEPEVQLI